MDGGGGVGMVGRVWKADASCISPISPIRPMNDMRTSRRFCELFRKEHEQFLSRIEGVTAAADRARCASLILSRLMFLCFLKGGPDFLQHQLAQSHTFFCQCLLSHFRELEREYPDLQIGDEAFQKLFE